MEKPVRGWSKAGWSSLSTQILYNSRILQNPLWATGLQFQHPRWTKTSWVWEEQREPSPSTCPPHVSHWPRVYHMSLPKPVSWQKNQFHQSRFLPQVKTGRHGCSGKVNKSRFPPGEKSSVSWQRCMAVDLGTDSSSTLGALCPPFSPLECVTCGQGPVHLIRPCVLS